MNRVTIDFETRSACDIRKHGAWVYSEHPTTEVLCLGVKWEGQEAKSFRPEEIDDIGRVRKLCWVADEIWAHNAEFEYAIWTNVCVKKYGWPPLPIDKLRDTAALAAMWALPRSLDGAGRALGLDVTKDKEGHRLMLKLCKPRRPRKAEREAGVPEDALLWHEKPEEMERLFEYCRHDVAAEEELMLALKARLPEKEFRIWQLDQAINRRGIGADIEGAKAMIEMVNEHKDRLLAQFQEMTYGQVKTTKQVAALKDFLRGLDCDLPNLQAATVKEALEDEDLNPQARDILEIRKSLGRSSAAKYEAFVKRACGDGRIRGALLYHGASTGRWAGSGVQPQNFPSRIKVSGDPEEMLAVIVAGGLELFEAIYDDDPMAAAAAICRSIFIAKDGHVFIAADYSAIEGRGLAWLAGEEAELKTYRSGRDVYVATAASILHKPYELVTKDERQTPGKIAVLACGYGGGAGAVRKFGGGEGLSDEEIKEQIVNPWRKAHPMTVAFWRALEEAAFKAVQRPGQAFDARGVSFKSCPDGFLKCRLPSGRILYYCSPKILPWKTTWGEMKDSVTYYTVDSVTKQWRRTATYGGKLAENVTQAVCRDIMAEAMLRLEDDGYSVVLTVHDEIVVEVPEDFGSLDEMKEIMCQPLPWAKGFPIDAGGWRGKRYKK